MRGQKDSWTERYRNSHGQKKRNRDTQRDRLIDIRSGRQANKHGDEDISGRGKERGREEERERQRYGNGERKTDL
jgi:hypothetical protein